LALAPHSASSGTSSATIVTWIGAGSLLKLKTGMNQQIANVNNKRIAVLNNKGNDVVDDNCGAGQKLLP
jgi:hypothetical protein